MPETPRSDGSPPPGGTESKEDSGRGRRRASTQMFGSLDSGTEKVSRDGVDVPRDRTPRDHTPRDRTPLTDPPSVAGPETERPPPPSIPRAVLPFSVPPPAALADEDADELPPLESEPTQAAIVHPSGSVEVLRHGQTDPGDARENTDPGEGGSTDPGRQSEPDPEPAGRSVRPLTGFSESEEDEEEDPFGDLKPGSRIGGRYTLERVLGRGAMGVVFEASHSVIGKRVAVKCLYPRFRASRVVVERFFREARIAATVEHPNVIQVFDGGDEKETLFLAMELLDGETLADRLERAGKMQMGEAVETFIGIMNGVAAVHARGVVHRDLKPDNIFLVRPRYGRPQEPKVLDFGISKLKEPGAGRDLTSMGMVMGTPYYMAPEQVASSRDVDARADVYSLGVMLYEALTDELPYDGETVADIFQAAQEADAVPLDRREPSIPRKLAAFVERAMQPDLERRYASVQEMRDALVALELHSSAEEVASRDQIRMTVREFMSPLATGDVPALPPRSTGPAEARAPGPRHAARPPVGAPADENVPNTTPGRRAPMSAEERRSTVQLARPDPRLVALPPKRSSDEITIPQWAIAVIVAAGIVTFGAVFTALLALLL